MPRNKKNKGNAGPAAPSTNNKAKSPAAETKVTESIVAPVVVPVETDTTNDELKARLANAKERLHLLQEVIGGIGDPTDTENFKASSIDAAKEKLNTIQESVDSMKTTLLEVRQETARSVTPEGSQSGTNKRRKNKKHQNQNPPQGFVVREPSSASNAGEIKSKPDTSENEGSAQEDGTSTISKKKRNRNRKKKAQHEQSGESESQPQELNVTDKTETPKLEATISENKPKAETKEKSPEKKSQPETKENTPEANKSKNNKKNNKKGQQKPANEKIETVVDAVVADVKPIEPVIEAPPAVEVKTNTQPPSNNKNKNKNKNKQAQAGNKDAEKSTEASVPTPAPADQQQQKGNEKSSVNVADSKAQQPMAKPDEKKEEVAEENLPKEVPKTPEPQKVDSPKNKKDKKKGQPSDIKQTPSKVEEKQPETKVIEVPKDEAKIVDTQISKIEETPKSQKDDNQRQTAQSETKTEEISAVPIASIEGKKVPDSSHTQKNKKNKQNAPAKIVEKPVESPTAELTSKLVPEILSSEQSAADAPKDASEVQSLATVIQKEEPNQKATSAPIVESLEKDQCLKPSTVQNVCKTVPDNNNEIQTTAQSQKQTVDQAPTDNTETTVIAAAPPPLPKLDFSQVVKDNKDKIPLMEIKVAPMASETVSGSKPVDAPIKSTPELPSTYKAPTDACKPADDIPIETSVAELTAQLTTEPILDNVSKSLPEVLPKPDVSLADSDQAKLSTPVPTAVEAVTSPKQNKDKTPERKGNQSNVKNEQKKQQQQQGKGQQNAKQKQNEQKSQAAKKEEVKQSEVAKSDAEKKAIPEDVVVTGKASEKVEPEKTEIKSDTPATKASAETKQKEEIVKPNENLKKDQAKTKPVEDKVESKPVVTEKKEVVEIVQKKPDSIDKPQPIIEDKPSTVIDKPNTSAESQTKDNKSEILSKPQPQKQEMSKKDQKKQNKMKGKAPQPPDIPMDMSLLSASMIDPSATDEVISHEESEDQSSLIASDSKNVAGSGFVQSVESSMEAVTDEAKSLESIQVAPEPENKVTESERDAKSASPSNTKRNKEMANLKESVEMQEGKRQELPEKSAQQKMEPVQFPAVKLMDILEATMTSPTTKPGSVAGNVRKLPRDTKRTEQLNVQQPKSRSKSPKENAAEKYVKNQKLASGDNKKQGAQSLKSEILKTEVGSLVTCVNKEKETKAPTNTDANSNESKITSGTASITTVMTENEQVGILKESDVTSKQTAEPLPNDAATADTSSKQSNDDGKTDGKDETTSTKPKIAPKPTVPLKSTPKNVDRSKKSPVKTPENKTPANKTPANKTLEPKTTGNKTPEAKTTGNKTPEPKSPGNKTPEVKTPGNKIPESKNPVNKTPEAKTPGNKTPEAKTPANKTPESKTTGNKNPEVKTAGNKSPESKTAGNRSPENKTQSKQNPCKELSASSKAPAQAKLVPQSNSPAKPSPQAKSQPKAPPQTTTVTESQPSSSQANDDSQLAQKPEVSAKPNLPNAYPSKLPPAPIQDEEEEFVEYKFTPRPVFISTACQICKVPLDIANPCKLCQMVSYCSEEHEKEDLASHGPLCNAMQEIAKKRGELHSISLKNID